MNRATLAFIAATGLAPLCASATVISLDRPGVLEAIAAENPDHHQRLVGILRASQEMPCQRESLQRLAVDHEVREARCSTTILTSLPSKRRLHFRLDGQAYVATVEMNDHWRNKVVPVK